MSITLRDLLRENMDVDDEDVWENERMPTPVRCFAVRVHWMGFVGVGSRGVSWPGWVSIAAIRRSGLERETC